MRRRSVLAGAVAAPLVLGLGIHSYGAGQNLPALTLFDARLAKARRAAHGIQLRGGATRETGGEIASLLLRERPLAQGGIVLGLTGHAEFLLASDIARLAGRTVKPLMQSGSGHGWLGDAAGERWMPLLAEMLNTSAGPAAKATVFAWIAA